MYAHHSEIDPELVQFRNIFAIYVLYDVHHMTTIVHICDLCNKTFSKRSNLKRHMENTDHSDKTSSKYCCNICNTSYKSKSGLWYHKKQCVSLVDTIHRLQTENEMLKQINVLQSENIALKSAATTHVDNSINIVQNFNVGMFLNSTCKDAVDITDLRDKLLANMQDVLAFGQNRDHKAIADILIREMKEYAITKRPMHFYEPTLYIKHDNEWIDGKQKTHDMTGNIIQRTFKSVDAYYDENYELFQHPDETADAIINAKHNIANSDTQIKKVMSYVLPEITIGLPIN